MQKEVNGNSYSKQISRMGNTDGGGKIVLKSEKNAQMSSIGNILLWFSIFIIFTISIGFLAVLAKLPPAAITVFTYFFYFFIIMDGVFFITLIVLIIDSIKRRGFE